MGFFDQIQHTIESPMFLGGIGMMSGGFQGMGNGLFMGHQLQDARHKRSQEAASRQSIFDLLESGDVGPMSEAEKRYFNANPDQILTTLNNVYAERFDPNSGLRRRGMEADLEYKHAMIDQARQPKARNAPAGYRWSADGGSLEPIPGGPASGAKRDLKEYQTKDAMLAERLMRAEAAIDKVAGIDATGAPRATEDDKGNKTTAYNPAQKRNAWWPDSGYLGLANAANSSDWQQYQQAAREGIASILRKDTGAAVTQTEWDLYFPMLYPQPGDAPGVVLQKKRAREAASQALRGSSGPAFDVMFPNGPAIPGQSSAPQRAQNPQTGEVIEWNGHQWVPVQ